MRAGAELLSPEAGTHAHAAERAPLIAHVIYSLKVGGLENGLVNLINHLPNDRFRHAIICISDYSDFHTRIRGAVELYALHKPPGKGLGVHLKLWRLLRKLRPQIVHTRNLAALECHAAAALAGVPVRIHGEHGRDIDDLDGSNRKYRMVRRALRPFVHQYIALSKDLERYLRDVIGVPAARLAQLYNGVDTELFHPPASGREALPPPAFAGPGDFIIGTVGRMHPVKDQVTLARAFVALARMAPQAAPRLRLVMIGDGPLRAQVLQVLEQAGLAQFAWLPGERDDVAAIMRALDVFVLPSLAEGISNTILEAMATGLPVVATAVGGNPELVDGRCGHIVPSADPAAMAQALLTYHSDAGLRARHGRAARARAKGSFSIAAMVQSYMDVYERKLLPIKERRKT